MFDGTCLELWEGEEKEEESFDFPVKRKPINGSCGGVVYTVMNPTNQLRSHSAVHSKATTAPTTIQ
jgi:(Na+)-NQR maturation NqrM